MHSMALLMTALQHSKWSSNEVLILWHHDILLRIETVSGCISFCEVTKFVPQWDLHLSLLPGAFYVFFSLCSLCIAPCNSEIYYHVWWQRPQTRLSTERFTSWSACFALIIINPSAWSDGHCPHTVNITCRGVTGTARMLHALTHSSISRQVREQM